MGESVWSMNIFLFSLYNDMTESRQRTNSFVFCLSCDWIQAIAVILRQRTRVHTRNINESVYANLHFRRGTNGWECLVWEALCIMTWQRPGVVSYMSCLSCDWMLAITVISLSYEHKYIVDSCSNINESVSANIYYRVAVQRSTNGWECVVWEALCIMTGQRPESRSKQLLCALSLVTKMLFTTVVSYGHEH